MRRLLFGLVAILGIVGSATGQTVYTQGPFQVYPAFPEVIYLHGDIGAGAAAAFDQVLADNPAAHSLMLDSLGGVLSEATAIADTVFARRLGTYILQGDTCFSACAYIFLAGDLRLAVGLLGVRLLDADAAQEGVQPAGPLIQPLLDRFGVSPEVRDAALTTQPADLRVFSPDEVVAYRINRPGVPPAAAAPAAPPREPVPPRAAEDEYQVATYTDLDFFGADIGSVEAPNFQQCQAACAANLSCRAFTYSEVIEGGPNCFLKDAATILDVNVTDRSGLLIALDDVAPRFSVAAIDPTTDLIEGRAFPPGGDMPGSPLRGVDAQACRLACVESSQCVAFSYIREAQQCWLKDEVNTSIVSEGILSGVKRPRQTITADDVVPLE